MRFLVPLFAVLGLTLANTFQLEPLSDEEIFYINSLSGIGWTAGRNFYPNELPRVKRMLGVNIAENKEYNRLHLKYEQIVVSDALPDNFDPRTKWTNCPSLNEIRDQANCGSCWAFGAVEAITDRICIKGGGQVNISAEDVNDCCLACGMGCDGGFPSAVWSWYVKDGIVTGGQYGTNEGCKPYSLPHCDHHTTGKYSPCSGSAKTPSCKKDCRSGYNKTYTEDKRKGSKSYGIQGVEQIMQDLVDNGPVTAAFTVYNDFLSYKTGVYKHTTGEELGGHAVKIIGYGVENGVNYWLVANSWNEDWGDKGFFKILRGVNECGIEDEISAEVYLLWDKPVLKTLTTLFPDSCVTTMGQTFSYFRNRPHLLTAILNRDIMAKFAVNIFACPCEGVEIKQTRRTYNGRNEDRNGLCYLLVNGNSLNLLKREGLNNYSKMHEDILLQEKFPKYVFKMPSYYKNTNPSMYSFSSSKLNIHSLPPITTDRDTNVSKPTEYSNTRVIGVRGNRLNCKQNCVPISLLNADITVKCDKNQTGVKCLLCSNSLKETSTNVRMFTGEGKSEVNNKDIADFQASSPLLKIKTVAFGKAVNPSCIKPAAGTRSPSARLVKPSLNMTSIKTSSAKKVKFVKAVDNPSGSCGKFGSKAVDNPSGRCVKYGSKAVDNPPGRCVKYGSKAVDNSLHDCVKYRSKTVDSSLHDCVKYESKAADSSSCDCVKCRRQAVDSFSCDCVKGRSKAVDSFSCDCVKYESKAVESSSCDSVKYGNKVDKFEQTEFDFYHKPSTENADASISQMLSQNRDNVDDKLKACQTQQSNGYNYLNPVKDSATEIKHNFTKTFTNIQNNAVSEKTNNLETNKSLYRDSDCRKCLKLTPPTDCKKKLICFGKDASIEKCKRTPQSKVYMSCFDGCKLTISEDKCVEKLINAVSFQRWSNTHTSCESDCQLLAERVKVPMGSNEAESPEEILKRKSTTPQHNNKSPKDCMSLLLESCKKKVQRFSINPVKKKRKQNQAPIKKKVKIEKNKSSEGSKGRQMLILV